MLIAPRPSYRMGEQLTMPPVKLGDGGGDAGVVAGE
jgi:hypothetical protein